MVTDTAREVLARARRSALADPGHGAPPTLDAIVADVARVLEAKRHGPTRVLNATGVVLHTNLGRAPLAPAAIAAAAAAAGYSDLELDLDTGQRGSRHAHVAAALRRLTGAEDALVVNNCAGAMLLAIATLAAGGEVIVSRGELIEIGGAFRMPEVIAQSGARLVEVGTTNRTTLADYAHALNERTRLVLKSHCSNYRVVGFTAAPEPAALAALAHERGLPLLHDLGSGALVDLARFGLDAEPTVRDALRAGADLVAFSGDKLLGGPQAGVLAGRADLVAAASRHPLARALRIDKMTVAALAATLAIYEREPHPEASIPALRQLAEPLAAVRRRARRTARLVADAAGLACEMGEESSVPGGGSLPGATLPTCVLRLRAAGRSAQALERALRQQRPPVVSRIRDDRVVIDLRTIADAEVPALAAALRGAAA